MKRIILTFALLLLCLAAVSAQAAKFSGSWSYSLDLGAGIFEMQGGNDAKIENTDVNDVADLRLQVWCTESRYEGGNLKGYILCEKKLGSLEKKSYLHSLKLSLPFDSTPPSGSYHTVVCLANGKQILDFMSLDGAKAVFNSNAVSADYAVPGRRDEGSSAGPAALPDTSGWNIAGLDTARNVDYLSNVEKDVILEMNMARSNPKKYAEMYIEPMIKKFNGKKIMQADGVWLVTNEGASAVRDCVNDMKKRSPLKALKPMKGLSQAALWHAESQSKRKTFGHTGVDGSSPDQRMKKFGLFGGTYGCGENMAYGSVTGRDIVVQLLIDDGVPSRGHRHNILKPDFSQAGCGLSESLCVIDYAYGYIDN